MAMNSDIKQQILYDSFNMFKDDWDNNVETLSHTITKTATIDLKAAIQMWEYLLNTYPHKIKSESEITSGILNELHEESYNEIVEIHFLIEKIFKYSCEPWESAVLISHFITIHDYYTANKLLELVSMNTTVSKYNYTDYKSSNLSTCLFKVIDRLYNLNDDDIDFFSTWTDRVKDKNDQIKLKVLMISKEASENQYYTYGNNKSKNDYLLENAALEDLEFASSNREDFEIKKLIQMIGNDSINTIDISRLDISWLINLFTEHNGYSKTTFNIIGAYFLINSFSWETKNIIKEIYKEKRSIKSIVRNSYRGETELGIKQRVDSVMTEISISKSLWDFNTTFNSCNNILNLGNAFQDYLTGIEKKRAVELTQYYNISTSSLGLNKRISNILIQNNILTFSQLIELLDSGITIDGLGNKSLKILNDTLDSFGIQLISINDDINFIFDILDINCNANSLNGSYEVSKMLKIPPRSFSSNLKRYELKNFIDKQSQIAQDFMVKYSHKGNNSLELLSLLRKDDKSIYLLGKFFFTEVTSSNLRIPYLI